MARGRGPQYIDRMLSTRFPWAYRLLAARPLQGLPTQCVLCRSWQSGTVCQACRQHWRGLAVRCQRCAIDLPQGFEGDTCLQCEAQSPEFDRAVAALDYAAPWSPLLARLKFNGATELARPLADLLAQAVTPRMGLVSVILPVPLSRERLIERGYNQSWLIARELSRLLGVPARHDWLARSRHTSRMMTLSAEARQAHIRGAFALTAKGLKAIQGQNVALVDDVMTTGATLNAISQLLLEGGARSVSAWVVARTPAPPSATRATTRAEQAQHERPEREQA